MELGDGSGIVVPEAVVKMNAWGAGVAVVLMCAVLGSVSGSKTASWFPSWRTREVVLGSPLERSFSRVPLGARDIGAGADPGTMADERAVTFDEVRPVDASRDDRPSLGGPVRPRRRLPPSRGQLFTRRRVVGTS